MTEILDIIIGAGIIQGLFLAFFLLKNKKGNQKANKVLAVLLLAFSVSLLHTFINIKINIKHATISLKVREPFQFLFGPLIYFYARELTSSVLVFRKKDFFHFIPFPIVLFIIMIPLLFKNIALLYLTYLDICIWIALLLHLMIYFVLIRKRVNKHKLQIKKNFSTIDKINFEWLNLFLYVLMLLYIIYFFLFIYILHNNPFSLFSKVIALTLSLAIYTLGYKGFSQPEIFFYYSTNNKNNDREKKSDRYEKSGLSKSEGDKIKVTLLDFMEKKKPFLNPELTLPDLAEQIGINRNYISQVINENIGKSFYDLINYYRVETVKKALLDPKNTNYTILSLAFDAGFNSKATFNSVFKKITGVTPSFYMRKIKK